MKLATAIKAAIAATAIVSCAAPVAAQTIKIGFISTFSGPSAKYGEKLNPDYVEVAAWDTMDAIYYTIREQKGKVDPDRTMELVKNYKNPDSPRGPISIDPATRDIVQNMYLREVRKVGGRLVNVELATVGVAIKDPWKELNKK